MEEEDADSNMSQSGESLYDCNQLNFPYINATSVFAETSEHSTTSSDDSLYQEHLWQMYHETNSNASGQSSEDVAPGPSTPPDRSQEKHTWMKLKDDIWKQVEGLDCYFVTICEGSDPPPYAITHLPASSWEPMVPVSGISEDTIQAKAQEPTSPSEGKHSQPSIRGAITPAKGHGKGRPPPPSWKSGHLPNYICKLPAVLEVSGPGSPYGIPPKAMSHCKPPPVKEPPFYVKRPASEQPLIKTPPPPNIIMKKPPLPVELAANISTPKPKVGHYVKPRPPVLEPMFSHVVPLNPTYPPRYIGPEQW